MSPAHIMSDLAVIIVSWNVRDYLADCLRSVYTDLNRSGLAGTVWVVDNASTDGSQALVSDLFPQARLITNPANVGFGAANNQGMTAAVNGDDTPTPPRYFFLLNPDTLVRPGAIAQLVRCLDGKPAAGMAGPRLVYADGRFQHSAFAFPGLAQLAFDLWPLPDRLYESRLNGRYPRRLYRPDNAPFNVDHPLGAAMMVRRDVAEATGGFDESLHMYCEEIDWCWRIRQAGWTIYTVPAAEIVHHGGQSTKQIPAHSILNLWRSRAQLYQKHYGRLTLLLARYLAQAGLSRKAAQMKEPALKHAYNEAATLWR